MNTVEAKKRERETEVENEIVSVVQKTMIHEKFPCGKPLKAVLITTRTFDN